MVWVIALLALAVTRQYTDTPNEGLVFIIAMLASAMVVCWFGAVVRLATQRSWGWLVAVLVLQLMGLGIIGMAAYMLAGPADLDTSRPSVSD
jgi:hypothetical protein